MSNREISKLYENVCRGDRQTTLRNNLYNLVYERSSENSELKELCSKLNDIGDRGFLSGEDLIFLNQFLDSRAYLPVIVEYLNSSNITDRTLSDKNAVEGITNIFQNNGISDKFAEYIRKPLSFSILGRSGSLIDVISNEVGKYGISTDIVVQLMQFEGTEGGRGVGQCELGLATMFRDVTVRDGHGDLSLNGEYLEVKGSAARLGGRDVPFNGFDQSLLGQLASMNNLQGIMTKGGLKYNIVETFVNLKKRKVDDSKLKQAMNEFVSSNYQYAKAGPVPSFHDANKLRVYLETCYFTHYAYAEGVEHFIFLNTKTSIKKGSEAKTPTANFGKYIIFKTGDIPMLLQSRALSASTITSLNVYPSIGAPKVGNIPDENAESNE
jgi:hypothetical protein